MKKATQIIIIMLLVVVFALPASAKSTKKIKLPKGLYPTMAQVTEIKKLKHKNYRKIIATDGGGRMWSFYDDGTETWLIGDFVAFIMYDRGTPKVKDDIIVGEPRYCGFKDLFK